MTTDSVELDEPFLVEFSETIPEDVVTDATKITKIYNETTDVD